MSKPYYSDDGVTLHHGDALTVIAGLPDQSVDCIVTSPPYLGLRDYGVTGTDWPAVTYPPMHGLPVVDVPAMTCPLGFEPTIESFVGHLVLIFEQARRVLADDGTLFLNLGDSYASQGGGGRGGGSMLQGRKHGHAQEAKNNRRRKPGVTLPEKNLLGIPWRVAFALQADDSGDTYEMLADAPRAVSARTKKSEPLRLRKAEIPPELLPYFRLVKRDRWILRNDVIWAKSNGMPESVRDRLTAKHEHIFLFAKSPRYYFNLDPIREPHASEPGREGANYMRGQKAMRPVGPNSGTYSEGGRNPGDVWTIPTVPFPGAHFAVFPPALAERAVLAGCKPGGTVLDPFSGSGTTGMVAARHGHRYVGIDASRDYLDLSLRTRLAQGALIEGDTP